MERVEDAYAQMGAYEKSLTGVTAKCSVEFVYHCRKEEATVLLVIMPFPYSVQTP
jgi:hypothetical protein